MKKILLTIIALLCIVGSQANNETLPNAKVGKGMATLKVRMIDYKEHRFPRAWQNKGGIGESYEIKSEKYDLFDFFLQIWK